MIALSASEVETFRLVFQPPRQCHLNTQDDRSIFRHKQAENVLQLRSGLHGLSWTIIDCHGHGLDLDILFTDRRTDIGTF